MESASLSETKPRATKRGRTFLAFVVVCIVLGFIAKFAATVRQWILPSYARREFIEAHYAPQLNALRRLAESGEQPDDAQQRLFDSTDILGARVITRYGEGGKSAVELKDTGRAEPGGAWFRPAPTTKHAVITIWGGASVEYELQVQAPDQKLRGFQLFLDLNALKELDKHR